MENKVSQGSAEIALFMGFTKCDEDDYMEVPEEQQSIFNYGYYKPNKMKYHSSWDWIMPVVEKIERMSRENGDSSLMFTFFGGKDYCGVRRNDLNGDVIVLKASDTKITAYWQCVIEFINWYNTTQSSKK